MIRERILHDRAGDAAAAGGMGPLDPFPPRETTTLRHSAAQETRVKHVDAAERLAADWIAGHTADEIVDLLGRAGVPAARVASIAEVADNPQLRHRERIVRVDHPSAGALPTVGPVIGLSESPAAIRRPAPRLGKHTDEVLRDWLDLPPERITALRGAGVVT